MKSYDDDPHGHSHLLKRLTIDYRAAAHAYAYAASMLTAEAARIEARGYQPEEYPEGWVSEHSVTVQGDAPPPGWISTGRVDEEEYEEDAAEEDEAYTWECSKEVEYELRYNKTSFSYANDDDDPFIVARFDLDDMRHAVRALATSYDAPENRDGSERLAREEALQLLRLWSDCIGTLMYEIEQELK